ncbi:unnamed protein product (macronuclear) [Paramecium tetraurelia]|uniref:MIF4G domain-containing protein n=1 Tax=Paramecium tetraurelia TaxID=5888 RepID=A0DKR0_PARTE|nr:uncharacterized protein GSPATT00017957001 [Paramecium tetraurelia]CAK83627.1 unnamed protein product [Paramecium tetraurelia]|eukprot:XP_001451024.1 hypothetical protein (macronuclear) [Paramecium tetraurelia strain d4-2]
MIKRNTQLKKQIVSSRNQGTNNKACLKPQVFQFPQLMNKTTTFSEAIRFQGQIQQPLTPEIMIRQSMNKPKMIEQPKFKNNYGVQRFSAKVVSKQQNVKEPVIIKITTSKNQQVIQQLEEQSEYQLSELGTFDDLIQQIQERVLAKNSNISQLAQDICSIEAIDLRGLQCIPQLIKHLVISSVQQQLQIPQILSILFTLSEEIMTRDDLDESLMEIIKVYLQRGYETNLQMIVVFIKRCGQMIYYIRANKQKVLSELLITLLLKFNGFNMQEESQLQLAFNIVLRHKQLRLYIKDNKDIVKLKQPTLIEQLQKFKITIN